MKASSGEVLAFEINPRISTTMVMAIAAGIDPFESFGKGRICKLSCQSAQNSSSPPLGQRYHG